MFSSLARFANVGAGLVAPSLVVAAWLIGVGLSAIRATAARNGLEDLGLFAGTGVLDKMADVDDALEAGVGAFVLVVGGRVEGIAGWRYPLDVHSVTAFLWAGLRGISRQTPLRGHLYVTGLSSHLYVTGLLSHLF